MMSDYEAYAHAVQSGVAAEMAINPGPTSPKHLRTGLDMRAADHKALAKLLIAKGVFTIDEYRAAITDAMREEKERYEKHLSEMYGKKITLA